MRAASSIQISPIKRVLGSLIQARPRCQSRSVSPSFGVRLVALCQRRAFRGLFGALSSARMSHLQHHLVRCPNKRIKVMAFGHSTRKTLRVLLAPYARRWALRG